MLHVIHFCVLQCALHGSWTISAGGGICRNHLSYWRGYWHAGVGVVSYIYHVHTGGAGPCATNFFKRLAAMQAEQHHSTYSTVKALLQCYLNFALLRSSIPCLRSVRSSFCHPGWIDRSAACQPCNVRGTGGAQLINSLLIDFIVLFITFDAVLLTWKFIVF